MLMGSWVRYPEILIYDNKNFFQNACDAVTLLTLSIKKDTRVAFYKIGKNTYLTNQRVKKTEKQNGLKKTM